jgi:methylated-DNA-protein-cysteine methyltransferase-like protein
MPRVDTEFKQKVYQIVEQIPKGRVMIYGQIAAICGAAWAAWEVGQIAHYGPDKLPWHRVVNKKGGMASGFVGGGREKQRDLLEAEGIIFKNDSVDVGIYLWHPELK